VAESKSCCVGDRWRQSGSPAVVAWDGIGASARVAGLSPDARHVDTRVRDRRTLPNVAIAEIRNLVTSADPIGPRNGPGENVA